MVSAIEREMPNFQNTIRWKKSVESFGFSQTFVHSRPQSETTVIVENQKSIHLSNPDCMFSEISSKKIGYLLVKLRFVRKLNLKKKEKKK